MQPFMMKSLLLTLIICFLTITLKAQIPDANGIVYVKYTLTGSGDGSSWANATDNLQYAIDAVGTKQVWVAAGSFDRKVVGTTLFDNTTVNAFLNMKSGVAIYGGFAGTETSLSDRDLSNTDNKTTLYNADRGATVNNLDLNNTAILDGFTVLCPDRGGGAAISNKRSSPIIRNVTITSTSFTYGNSGNGGGMHNQDNSSPLLITVTISGNSAHNGGGMYNYNSSPILTNVTIRNNIADGGDGGGMYNFQSSPSLTNVTINGNKAESVTTLVAEGGGMYNDNSSPTLTNVTITGNTAQFTGGVYNKSSAPILTNVKITGNTAGEGAEMQNDSSSPILTNVTIVGSNVGLGTYGIMNTNASNTKIRNSIIYGGVDDGVYTYGASSCEISYSLVKNFSSTANGNIDATNITLQQLFLLPNSGNYTLKGASPAINVGNNGYYANDQTPNLSGITTDLLGNNRIRNGAIDLGAYESAYLPPILADADGVVYIKATATGLGNGSSWANATDRLKNAIITNGVNAVWVAEGEYLLSGGRLKNNVAVYGGFSGTESNLTERNWVNHLTTLKAPYSSVIYNYFTSSTAIDNTAVLDGFTITGGTTDFGGGIFNYYSSPTLKNIIISGNTATKYGGGIYNANSSPNLINVTISGNTSEFGGGIYNTNSSPILSDVTVSNNIATASGGGIFNNSNSASILTNVKINGNEAAGNGGGMCNSASSPTLTNITISGNTSQFGGGIYNANSSPILSDVTVSNNKVTASGGGIFNNSNSSSILTNVKIKANEAASYGGGMCNYTSSPTLNNVIISGNIGSSRGGGIYNTSSSPTLTNVLISGNTSTAGGGICNIPNSSPILTNVTVTGNVGAGIYNQDSSSPKIRNSIIYGNNNGGFINFSSSPEVRNSLVQGSTDTTNGNISETGIAAADIFNAPATAGLNTGGDYTLKIGSPAINAGDKTVFDLGKTPELSTINFDLANSTRIQKGEIDLGAYESNYIIIKPDANGIVYVKTLAAGSADGGSWANATSELQAAINAAGTISIWVAKGVHQPASGSYYKMKNGVAIYGGFAGTETAVTERSWTNNMTTLKGNNESVFKNTIIDNSAVLDGFTLTNGASVFGSGIYNTNSSPIIKNVIINDNTATYGGAIYNENSSPILTNVTVSNNKATARGGGIYNNNNSAPILTNVKINGNESATYGGGMLNYNSSPTLTNVSISANKAITIGGGIYNDSSSPILTNITIVNNTATDGGGIYNITSSKPKIRNSVIYGNNSGVYNSSSIPTISHSLIQGSGGSAAWVAATGTDEGNNIDVNPIFISTSDYNLKVGSPAINVGDKTLYDIGKTPELSTITLDLAGNSRIQKGAIDLGAFESANNIRPNPSASGIVYVKPTATGTGDGGSWANATNYLQVAIEVAGVTQVWVSEGTYPLAANTSYEMKNGVAIYGGFSNTGTPIFTDRDWAQNVTILSGNGNSVIKNVNIDNRAILNGFTITGGNGEFGGGIYNDNGSPIISNVIISGNTGEYGGGIYNQNSSPILTNVIIKGNVGTNRAGGMGNKSYSSPILTNVTISGNTATNYGGGMYNVSSCYPEIRNSIIYGNNTGIYNYDSNPIIRYSLIQGNSDVTNGNINATNIASGDIFNAPLAAGLNNGGDYSLKSSSTVINLGNNDYFAIGQTPNLSTIITDLAGNTRIQKGAIDIGAYESSALPIPKADVNGIVYVKTTAIGNRTGNSWQNATDDLQQAIEKTTAKVFVAAGTYVPIYPANNLSAPDLANRDNAFVLKNNIKIYGSFNTTTPEASPNLRDTSATSTNKSVLSGDFNNDDGASFANNGENTYHVVIAVGAVGAAELNGFVIQGGNANSTGVIVVNSNNISNGNGAGVFTANSAPLLKNVTINGNIGGFGGGIYNYNSDVKLTNVSINGNSAANGGGGIYNNLRAPELTNVLINGNFCNYGAGIYNEKSSPILRNVSIVGNNGYFGGSMYNNNNSNPIIRNSIIYNNAGGIQNFSSTPVVSYSLVQGMSEDVSQHNLNGSTSPLFTNAPSFSTAPFTNGDYTLQEDSPAINTGDNSLNSTTNDLAGNIRVQKGNID